MIASVIADIAFNWGSYQYLGYTVYTCGNPKCSGTFRLTSKVCPRCGEEIDWEGIATRKVKVCPQCNLQFGKEDNYCPYHLPRVALIEKEIPK